MSVAEPQGVAASTADADQGSGRCNEDGCTAADDGNCKVGHKDWLSCENFEDDGLEPDDTLVGEHPDERAVEQQMPLTRGRQRLHLSEQSLAVHSGQALTLSEASTVMGAYDTEVVVVLGDVEVGKTTLLAALYERLAGGPIGGWAFAGSNSLIGFEARSFQATAASRRSREDTPRTSRSTEKIVLHLAVQNEELVTRHLLLSDVSGEHVRTMISYNEPGDYTPLLRSGTRLLVLLDGARLTTSTDQNRALADARTLLRAVAEGADLRPGTPIELVVTKWDRCHDAQGLEGELERLLQSAAQWWSPVSLHRTAARPDGSGLEDLFGVLLFRRTHGPAPSIVRHPTGRALHRFRPNDGLARRFIAAASSQRP